MTTADGLEEGLTTADAAARLGVKRETLYAYVSRGVVTRTTSPDGRTSRFDPAEIESLRQGRRPEHEGELRTLITSRLTRVDDHGLWIRGHDLVQLVTEGASFTDVVDLLWDAPSTERWNLDEGDGRGEARTGRAGILVEAAGQASLLDALRVITALRSAGDPLRHDLSAPSVRSAGRGLIVALALGLPPRANSQDERIAAALWRRLAAQQPDTPRLRALDAAMALLVDHGLAGSSLAARIAASVRADPYSVVTAGLGVLGGTLHGAASAAVHEMLAEADAGAGAATAEAVGAAHRRLGVVPGFGHTVYTERDPRATALMDLVEAAWDGDPRLCTVRQVCSIVAERADTFPNVDLSLGALTWLAGMPVDAGEVIFAVARTAGWLAHAMEEYGEKPLRFRARARYEGARPSIRFS